MGCISRLKQCRIRRGLLGGVLVLIIVDVIWVASAALTKRIFDESYKKPLFTTYFKTVLFSLYLVAFIFWRPWQQMLPLSCCKKRRQDTSADGSRRQSGWCKNALRREDFVASGDEESNAAEAKGSTVEGGAASAFTCGKEEEAVREDWCSVEKERPFLRFNSGIVNEENKTCPIRPELETCMVGPPNFERICCRENEESDHEESPLLPCETKCCKVRFSRVVEVRQARALSSISQSGGSGANRDNDDLLVRRSSPTTLLRVLLLSLVFGVIWFFANYLYAQALLKSSVALVNTLSATSAVFVMVLAAFPFIQTSVRDKFTLSRLTVTGVSVVGAVLVGFSDSLSSKEGGEEGYTWSGAVFTVGGAILYACYIVLLRRFSDPDTLDVPMFFGFVGLFDTIIILPLIVVWHFAGIEQFLLPPSNDVWTLLLINGFVGTVLSELLWIIGVFLTSPLLGTLSLALITPLSILYSIVIAQDAQFSFMFLFGALLILLSFVGVAVLDHLGCYDPLWVGLKKLVMAARDVRSQRGFQSLSVDSQRLIAKEPSSDSQTTDYLL